jgi:hypothetical protein
MLRSVRLLPDEDRATGGQLPEAGCSAVVRLAALLPGEALAASACPVWVSPAEIRPGSCTQKSGRPLHIGAVEKGCGKHQQRKTGCGRKDADMNRIPGKSERDRSTHLVRSGRGACQQGSDFGSSSKFHPFCRQPSVCLLCREKRPSGASLKTAPPVSRLADQKTYAKAVLCAVCHDEKAVLSAGKGGR